MIFNLWQKICVILAIMLGRAIYNEPSSFSGHYDSGKERRNNSTGVSDIESAINTVASERANIEQKNLYLKAATSTTGILAIFGIGASCLALVSVLFMLKYSKELEPEAKSHYGMSTHGLKLPNLPEVRTLDGNEQSPKNQALIVVCDIDIFLRSFFNVLEYSANDNMSFSSGFQAQSASSAEGNLDAAFKCVESLLELLPEKDGSSVKDSGAVATPNEIISWLIEVKDRTQAKLLQFIEASPFDKEGFDYHWIELSKVYRHMVPTLLCLTLVECFEPQAGNKEPDKRICQLHEKVTKQFRIIKKEYEAVFKKELLKNHEDRLQTPMTLKSISENFGTSFGQELAVAFSTICRSCANHANLSDGIAYRTLIENVISAQSPTLNWTDLMRDMKIMLEQFLADSMNKKS